MIKIVTDNETRLEEMSRNLSPDGMSEPCANCSAVKDAVKNDDVEKCCWLTNYTVGEAKEEMEECKSCLWYWIDDVEYLDE